jgi:ATP-dependent DNA helicase RecG
MQKKETEQVEFKKTTSELKEAVISICAILNKHGKGELYFGVRNDGVVIGQEVSDKTLRSVSQTIAGHLEPKIFPTIEKATLEGKEIIKISFSGVDKPYFAYGRAYMRVADEDRQLSAKELKKMIIISEIYRSHWDSEWCELSTKAINDTTLQSFIRKAKQAGRMPDADDRPERILEKLHLAKKSKLSFAAKYLFTTEHQMEIQAAVFAGKDKLTFLDIKKYNQPLLNLLETAESYLKEKMNWRVEFVDFKRVEIPEIPLKALREALVNSLIHRNFNNPKGNEVAIYKDRIEIYNPGTFPEGLTPEDYIKNKARSYLRNPLIAEIFYLTKDVEKWGSGLRRIYDECRENGVEVQFSVVASGFVTTFLRPAEKEKFSPKISEKTREETRDKTRDKIIRIVKQNPTITSKELAGQLGITEKGIEWQLRKLKELGIIRRVGPKKGGHWEVSEK